MEAFLISTGVVALAEMGDKTQLLSLVLAARFRAPVPIILGILAATLLNHAGAGAVGALIMQWLGPDLMRWIIGVGFLAMAAWTLVPDVLDDEEAPATKYGVFAATFVAFFIAEMGEDIKTNDRKTAVPVSKEEGKARVANLMAMFETRGKDS